MAALALTGPVNSGLLVGPLRLSGLWTTPYGGLLLLFGVMLALAAINRFSLTLALARAIGANVERGRELARLRRSLLVETAVVFAVLLLVAWLGVLAPISAI